MRHYVQGPRIPHAAQQDIFKADKLYTKHWARYFYFIVPESSLLRGFFLLNVWSDLFIFIGCRIGTTESLILWLTLCERPPKNLKMLKSRLKWVLLSLSFSFVYYYFFKYLFSWTMHKCINLFTFSVTRPKPRVFWQPFARATPMSLRPLCNIIRAQSLLCWMNLRSGETFIDFLQRFFAHALRLKWLPSCVWVELSSFPHSHFLSPPFFIIQQRLYWVW